MSTGHGVRGDVLSGAGGDADPHVVEAGPTELRAAEGLGPTVRFIVLIVLVHSKLDVLCVKYYQNIVKILSSVVITTGGACGELLACVTHLGYCIYFILLYPVHGYVLWQIWSKKTVSWNFPSSQESNRCFICFPGGGVQV